jgi:hypothetical protein
MLAKLAEHFQTIQGGKVKIQQHQLRHRVVRRKKFAQDQITPANYFHSAENAAILDGPKGEDLIVATVLHEEEHMLYLCH